MSGCSMTLEKALEAATKKGATTVRVPADNELFLDIDSEEDLAIFAKHLKILEQRIAVSCVDIRPSKSGHPHHHVVVTLTRNVTDIERVALQACLGSDRLHELLSWIAIEGGETPAPTLFFEVA